MRSEKNGVWRTHEGWGVRISVDRFPVPIREQRGRLFPPKFEDCATSSRPQGIQRMIALTQEKMKLIDNKIRLLRQMRRDVAKMLHNLQTSAEKTCAVDS